MSDTQQSKDHDLLVRLDENVRNLVAQVANNYKSQAEKEKNHDEKIEDHETRIRTIENWRYYIVGVFAFLVFVITIAANVLPKIINK
jgi:VanZ family protein